jgi:hypothetical protein
MQGAKDLFGVCVHSLKSEFKKPKPDMQAIWGAICCLDHVMSSFGDVVEKTPREDIDVLYRCGC